MDLFKPFNLIQTEKVDLCNHVIWIIGPFRPGNNKILVLIIWYLKIHAGGRHFVFLVFMPILRVIKWRWLSSLEKNIIFECKCFKIVLESFPLMKHQDLFIIHSFLRKKMSISKNFTAWNFFIWPQNSMRVLMRTRTFFFPGLTEGRLKPQYF